MMRNDYDCVRDDAICKLEAAICDSVRSEAGCRRTIFLALEGAVPRRGEVEDG
jgi:hypothetical protein